MGAMALAPVEQAGDTTSQEPSRMTGPGLPCAHPVGTCCVPQTMNSTKPGIGDWKGVAALQGDPRKPEPMAEQNCTVHPLEPSATWRVWSEPGSPSAPH